MRTTRSIYQYAIRYVKKNEEIMRKEAIVQSISEKWSWVQYIIMHQYKLNWLIVDNRSCTQKL